jgi:DNA (cytosine-5)-methyltransferase 1
MEDNQVAYKTFREYTDCLYSSYGTKWNGNAAAYNGSLYVVQDDKIRRLSPLECERLMGFPDNYTNIPWKGKPSPPDGRRYKALGNSMAVPVMHWIGKRMMEAKTVVCDEDAIDKILCVTPSDDGQLSLF